MKYILFFALVLILLGTLIVQGCIALNSNLFGSNEPQGSDEAYVLYEGTGQGYRGPITVQVRMNGAHTEFVETGFAQTPFAYTEITEIIIIDSEEDRFVGGEAIEELIDLVILYNSTDLDAISGATETSKGFLEAVDNAIMKR